MARPRWRALAFVLAVAGCATLRPGGDTARSLAAGLRAFAAGDYRTAHGELDRAGFSQDGGEAARRALLLGALVQLDPRNPDRDFASAAERAAALRRDSADTSWMGVAGEVLVELSAELSAVRTRVRRAEQARQAAVLAAVLTQQSVNARVAAAVGERDAARRRAVQLADSLAAIEKDLKEKTQELERIRRTIRR